MKIKIAAEFFKDMVKGGVLLGSGDCLPLIISYAEYVRGFTLDYVEKQLTLSFGEIKEIKQSDDLKIR